MQEVIGIFVGLLRAAGDVTMTLAASLLFGLLLSVHAPAEAARSLRDTVCITPGVTVLDSEAAGKIGKLIAASARHGAVVGAFVSVFVRDDSLANLRDGISAASALLGHLKLADGDVRNWPFDFKVFPLLERSCRSGVLIELTIAFDEIPLVDPKP